MNWYFNSTIVRLKEEKRAQLEKDKQDFNSTIVRLKDASSLERIIFIRFQFYDSTIKSMFENGFECGFSIFQFYDSTIKSDGEVMTVGTPAEFQFYDSTIKSILKEGDDILDLYYFNSTIVRLKAAIKGVPVPRWCISILR